jgi:hypothetical protein
MRALVVLVALASCASPEPYTCVVNTDCGDGFCERDGLCSLADETCPSDRRYDAISGDIACVEGAPFAEGPALCGVTAGLPTGACAELICETDPSCCSASWDRTCARMAEARCGLACDEIVAAGGFSLAAVFSLAAPDQHVWSTNHRGFTFNPAWGDIEGDGRPDLAYAREAEPDELIPGVMILQSGGLSNGTLELTPATIAGDPVGTTTDVEWRDFDGDGDLDLLASGAEGIYLVVTEAGTFTAHQLSARRGTAAWLTTSSAPPWRIGVAHGDPAELVVHTFDESFAIDSTTSFGMREAGVAYCDVGGTPERDMIVGGDLYLANATGFAAPMSTSTSGFFPVCADLDGDGDHDLVLGGFDVLNVILNNGGLTADPVQFPITYPIGISVADFDNNGRLDVLASDGTNDRRDVPLLFVDNQPGGFVMQSILPDWNTDQFDSMGLDVGRPPTR